MNRLVWILAAAFLFGCGNGGNGSSEEGVIEPRHFDSDVEWVGDSHTAQRGFSSAVSDHFEPNRVRNYAIGATHMRVWSPIFGPRAFYFKERVGETTTANCFILLGTVDAAFGPTTKVPRFKAALEELAGIWLADGCGRAWIMVPPKVAPWHNQDVTELIELYEAVILKFCSDPVNNAMGVRCGPNLFRLLDPTRHLLPFPDGVHLNADGNDIITAEIESLLDL